LALQRTTKVSAAALGRHLGVSGPYVAQLASEGAVTRLPDGKYDQDACRIAYIKWLRDPARRTAPKSEAAARLQAAKATEVELRNLERSGQLGRLDEMTEVFDSAVAKLRTALDGLPARVTRDVALRRKIEDEIRAALTRACDAMERGAEALSATAQADASDAPHPA
jgi:phage terminase Nu1 subunit (DNA packaging protein)